MPLPRARKRKRFWLMRNVRGVVLFRVRTKFCEQTFAVRRHYHPVTYGLARSV